MRKGGWKPVKVRETEQKGERHECVSGGEGGGRLAMGGGGLGADQGHCAFHKPRSATQTPWPLCFFSDGAAHS